MAIHLDAFYKICNGTENVGEIRLNATGTGLEKINNHVYKTSKNNVSLSVEQKHAVRQALLDALSTLPLGKEHSKLENLLLGGGRGVQSLSRDFVRHLLSAASDPDRKSRNKRIAELESIDAQLRNRYITNCKGERTKSGELLVKSSKTEAFRLTVNELDDYYIRDARAALNPKEPSGKDPISDLLKKELHRYTDAYGLTIQKTKKISNAVENLVDSDSRLTDKIKKKIKETISALVKDAEFQKNIKRLACKGSNADTKLNAFLERKVRMIYNSAKIKDVKGSNAEDIIKQHLSAIFGDSLSDSSFADKYLLELRNSFFRIGQGLVNDLQEIEGIRMKFLDYVNDEIKNAKFPHRTQNALSKRINERKAAAVFLKLKVFSKNFNWADGPAAAEKLEELLRNELDAVFKAHEEENEVKKFKSEMWERLCGIGIGV